jgi:hypothetical protein
MLSAGEQTGTGVPDALSLSESALPQMQESNLRHPVLEVTRSYATGAVTNSNFREPASLDCCISSNAREESYAGFTDSNRIASEEAFH